MGQVFIDAGASKEDQNDKDLALVGAAKSGKVAAARALIAYGANPNVDLSKLTVTEESGGMTMEGQGAGSVLIYAAASGNPEMVREILRYHPKLDARDQDGKTAIFAATDYQSTDEEGARVKCVRILAQAGADVNAKDEDGNTPLHETFLTDVEEELLKLGANVNARNDERRDLYLHQRSTMKPFRCSSSMAPTSPFAITKAKRSSRPQNLKVPPGRKPCKKQFRH